MFGWTQCNCGRGRAAPQEWCGKCRPVSAPRCCSPPSTASFRSPARSCKSKLSLKVNYKHFFLFDKIKARWWFPYSLRHVSIILSCLLRNKSNSYWWWSTLACSLRWTGTRPPWQRRAPSAWSRRWCWTPSGTWARSWGCSPPRSWSALSRSAPLRRPAPGQAGSEARLQKNTIKYFFWDFRELIF